MSDEELQAEFLTLLENKVYIEVKPVDDWREWCYIIYLEDIMSPFFKIHTEFGFNSYISALKEGISYVKYNNLNNGESQIKDMKTEIEMAADVRNSIADLNKVLDRASNIGFQVVLGISKYNRPAEVICDSITKQF